MSSSHVNIKLLLDITSKKETVLNNILIICENQRTVLSNNHSKKEENKLFFNELGKEKQLLINEIQNLDQTFERVFQRISLVLDEELTKGENKVVAKELQDKITIVTVLDTKIRKLEDTNNLLLEKENTVPEFKAQNILNKYNKSNSSNRVD